VEIAPPLINTEHQSDATWNPIVRAILDEFGARKDVINALSRNLGTFSHLGSLVPYYRQYLFPLRELTQHSNPVVRRWARSTLEWNLNRVDEEQKRDDESKIGIR
jgi:hypothetical protein